MKGRAEALWPLLDQVLQLSAHCLPGHWRAGEDESGDDDAALAHAQLDVRGRHASERRREICLECFLVEAGKVSLESHLERDTGHGASGGGCTIADGQ